MKIRITIKLISFVVILAICICCLSIGAHAYEQIVDPYTIESLKAAQPDDVLHVIVDRFYVKDEKMEAMPSWPDLGAARKEFSAFVTEQNNLLIEEMKQVAEFDVRYVDLTVGRIHINIAAKEVEKLKNIEKISDIYVHIDSAAEPLSPTTPTAKVSGDADKDDELTVLDATAIQRYMAGLIDEEKIDLSSADFDKDDEVTILDATAIQRYLVGLT